MSGDQLTLRTPQDRVITEYVCDHEGIAECAAQLQHTGEETLELHQCMMSIISGSIEVQEGISIEQLKDMAMTVGDGLGPLGEYFCDLATATWAYADACRIAGDQTKHMSERVATLQNSLATLVLEREQSEGWLSSANALSDDETASGYLILYSVLSSEGTLDAFPQAKTLEGMPKEQAVPLIESHLAVLETLHGNVHEQNDRLHLDFDAAVDDWEGEADTFVKALDGILGVLADTSAEDDYQRLGTVGDVAAWVGTAADGATLIPFPPVAFGAALAGVLATAVEVAANGGQALKARYQPGDDSIRVVEGQIVGERDEAAVAASGFIPIVDLLKKVTKASDAQGTVADGIDTASGAPVDPGTEGRHADVPVDVGVSTEPIDAWQAEADATNPQGSASQAGGSMPTYDERAESVSVPEDVPPLEYHKPERPTIADLPKPAPEPSTAPVQLPTAEAPASEPSGSSAPVQLPTADEPAPTPTVETSDGRGSGGTQIEVEVDG